MRISSSFLRFSSCFALFATVKIIADYHIKLTDKKCVKLVTVLLDYLGCELLTLALISLVPLLPLTSLPFPSLPSPFSLVFPFVAPPLACEPLLSFCPLQL